MFFLEFDSSIYYSMESTIVNFFKAIDEVIAELVKDHTQLVDVKYYNTAQDAVEGVAYTMVAVFFLIDMIQNVLLKTDELRVEDVVKALLKLVVARACIGFTPKLLDALFKTAARILTTWKATNISEGKDKAFAKQMLIKMGLEYGGFFSSDTLTDLGFYIAHIIDFLILKISTLVMKAIAIARNFELLILRMLSSIPMAFLPWSETKDIPKRFFLNYFAVCLQGVVMIAGAVVLVSLLDRAGKASLAITSYTVVYLLTLLKSGQISKQIVGVA